VRRPLLRGLTQSTISDQAIAGYMVASIPIIASAIVKGGEVAFQAVSGAAALQSTASSEAASSSKGLVTQGNVSFDQQQLAPNRTSAFMTSTTDAWGTTIQGLGPDASAMRYQASMSRLPTTFTISERQAAAFGDTARQAETLARTEREGFTSSQAATLGRAMALQSGFEQSAQRAGDTSIGQSGSQAVQIQQLNAVARDVNRRLGLSDDSTVGKTVTAAASVGAEIPFTEIGAQLARSGQSVESERLTSAYDHARRATQTAQIGQVDSLVREFRESQAYQWARQQRTGATDSFESSWRETQERQTSADVALTRAWETARTAQFMAEWSSGAQTDFTNYAAQRLAERGLLKEQDPMRLQRAVTDIAIGYARGGHVGPIYAPADSPFLPDRQAATRDLGTAEPLDGQYRAITATTDDTSLRSVAATNDQLVALERSSEGLTPSAVNDDLKPEAEALQSTLQGRVAAQRAGNAEESSELASGYRVRASVSSISKHHGGNQAVWDTVGANAPRVEINVPSLEASSPRKSDIQEATGGRDMKPDKTINDPAMNRT
jgi:conjugal transfer mating pair stabilization protein TraG